LTTNQATYETLFWAVQELQKSSNHSNRSAMILYPQVDSKASMNSTDVSEEIPIAVPIIQVSRVRRLLLGVLGSAEVDDQGVARSKRSAVDREGFNKASPIASSPREQGLTSKCYARH
jgi:hypothetical protein